MLLPNSMTTQTSSTNGRTSSKTADWFGNPSIRIHTIGKLNFWETSLALGLWKAHLVTVERQLTCCGQIGWSDNVLKNQLKIERILKMSHKNYSSNTTAKDTDRWVKEGYDRRIAGEPPSRSDFLDYAFHNGRANDHDHYQREGEKAAERLIERGKK
jgi:hypothetical protein